MNGGLSTPLGRCVCAALVWFVVAGPCAAAQAPRRVLLIQSFGHGVEPYESLESAFRESLRRASREPVAVRAVSVDATVEPGGASSAPLVGYLKALETQNHFDLVVAIGGPAVNLIQYHRDEVFTSTPLLIAGSDVRHLARTVLTPRDAEVSIRFDVAGAFDNVFTLLPKSKGLVVILGASPLERFWAEVMRQEFAPFADRYRLTIWNDLAYEEILRRAHDLPPDSAILYGMYALDTDGTLHPDDAALDAIRAEARVPVFGVMDTLLGRGIVGGPLVPVRGVGEAAARAAARILAGEAPSAVRPAPLVPSVPTFDWREIARFKIDPARLPAHSVIQFRQPTVWEARKWTIVGIGLIALAEAALIVVLFTALKGRRRAEAATRDVSRRLIIAQEDERARLARELHDDITQRVARLAIDVGRIELAGPGADTEKLVTGVREGLVKLSEDVHGLSYRLHPSLLDDLGLPDALRVECERFTSAGAVPAVFQVHDCPQNIPRETAVCLFRVAQEALRNAHRHAGAKSVDVSLRSLDGGLQLAIRDDGVGFDPRAERARRSLGHASMSERVHLVDGELDIESAPGDGTTILAWVPLRRGEA